MVVVSGLRYAWVHWFELEVPVSESNSPARPVAPIDRFLYSRMPHSSLLPVVRGLDKDLGRLAALDGTARGRKSGEDTTSRLAGGFCKWKACRLLWQAS